VEHDAYHQVGCLHAGLGPNVFLFSSDPGVRASRVNDEVVYKGV
jgi:hypothetical protein